MNSKKEAPISEDEIRAMREVCEKATPGPWDITENDYADGYKKIDKLKSVSDGCVVWTTFWREEDAEFIAMARNNWSRLLDTIEQEREERQQVLDEAEQLRCEVERLRGEKDRVAAFILHLSKEREALKAEVERLREREASFEIANQDLVCVVEDFKREKDAWKARAEKLHTALFDADQGACICCCDAKIEKHNQKGACDYCIRIQQALADYRSSLSNVPTEQSEVIRASLEKKND